MKGEKMKPEFKQFLETKKTELAERLAQKEAELAADNGDAYETLQDMYLNGSKAIKDMPLDELIEDLGEDDESLIEYEEMLAEQTDEEKKKWMGKIEKIRNRLEADKPARKTTKEIEAIDPKVMKKLEMIVTGIAMSWIEGSHEELLDNITSTLLFGCNGWVNSDFEQEFEHWKDYLEREDIKAAVDERPEDWGC